MAMSNRKPLRVLYVSRAYSTQAGGMERLSAELYQALQHTPDTQISLLAHRGPRWLAPFFCLAVLPIFIFRARRADVVHLGDPLLAMLGWLAKKLLDVPVTVTVHGLDILYPNPAYQAYLKLFFDQLDAYLPISAHVEQLLTRRSICGTMQVIHPGATDALFDPATTRQQLPNILAKAGISADVARQKLLFTAGRLVRRKGHAWFIQNVLPQLPADVHYIIAGTGPELPQIQKTAAQAGVDGRVHTLDRVARSSLKVLYNTVDAFIQPNVGVAHDAEGFGLVLLEAALCARPVFAADIEGIRDAVHQGKNGTLLASGDPEAWVQALQKFIHTPLDGTAARAYTLRAFSWDKTAERYIGAWRALIPSTHP